MKLLFRLQLLENRLFISDNQITPGSSDVVQVRKGEWFCDVEFYKEINMEVERIRLGEPVVGPCASSAGGPELYKSFL